MIFRCLVTGTRLQVVGIVKHSYHLPFFKPLSSTLLKKRFAYKKLESESFNIFFKLINCFSLQKLIVQNIGKIHTFEFINTEQFIIK